MPRFCVRVADDGLVFGAAHFITTAEDDCERLHGHNYRVKAEVYGPLDDNRCVVDFIALRAVLRGILDELDHRVLLAGEHPRIRVEVARQQIEAAFGQRRWVFPQDDCRVLPIANTTAESLAEYLAERLRKVLVSQFQMRPQRLRIELEESPGLSAVCELGGNELGEG